MLRLLGVLLSCGALCLAFPTAPTARMNCSPTSIILETLSSIQPLKSEGSSKITPLNNMLEGADISTYLELFIGALKNGKKSLEAIAEQLRKLQDIRKSCPGWMEKGWKPMEEENFFDNLEYLLRFLNHNAPPSERGP